MRPESLPGGKADVHLSVALRSAVLAAVVAALAASAWHEVATEPLIDAAIEIEEAAHVGEVHEPVVSRPVQRIGLAVALVLYGVSWSLVLACVYTIAQRWLPGHSVGWRGVALAVAAGWAFAVLPFLKYPANPPGVGDPETIALRQQLYFAALGLGAVGVVGALVAGRHVSGMGVAPGWLAALAVVGAFSGAVLAFLPANPDPVPVSADLVAAFRLRSGLGLALHWLVFAGIFGLLVERGARRGRRVGTPAPSGPLEAD